MRGRQSTALSNHSSPARSKSQNHFNITPKKVTYGIVDTPSNIGQWTGNESVFQQINLHTPGGNVQKNQDGVEIDMQF